MNKRIQDELDLDRGVTVPASDLKVDVDAFNRLCELTREGKNICSKCGHPKQVYYRPWCPRCEKPELQTIHTLNLIQTLRHIQAIDNDPDIGYPGQPEYSPGYKSRVWNQLCERGILERNDSITYWLFYESWEVDEYGVNEVYLKDENRFREVFDLLEDDGVYLEVSW